MMKFKCRLEGRSWSLDRKYTCTGVHFVLEYITYITECMNV